MRAKATKKAKRAKSPTKPAMHAIKVDAASGDAILQAIAVADMLEQLESITGDLELIENRIAAAASVGGGPVPWLDRPTKQLADVLLDLPGVVTYLMQRVKLPGVDL